MRFRNKVGIVTGGGSGIGQEVARRFVAEGGRIVLNGRDEEKLKAAASEIGSNDQIAIVAADVADVATGPRLTEVATDRFGGCDVLFNNAGVFAPKPFVELTEADYDKFLDIILKGKFFVAQAVAKEMIKRGGGAIVQTGSLWAIQAIGATPSSAYSAANAGVHQLVKNLAIELAGAKIRVNAVAPAVVETPVYNTFMSDEEVAATLPTFDAFHPLGRNGQPADVAEAILFLASEQAEWITGQVLSVDGGVTAGHK